jgi:peptide/nickel transport system ATP-binding protein
MTSPQSSALLSVRDLAVHFPIGGRGRDGKPVVVKAVDGVSFELQRGRTLAIVGESGSGKTTTALSVLRLADPTAGSIHFDGTDMTALNGSALRRMRRRVQLVFQDPYSSLNPRQRAGDIVRAPLDLMGIDPPGGREARVARMFELVGLRPEQRQLFPHQFSGGQRQRLNVARALASAPDLIVCDEPVSALDIAIRAQILNLLRRIQREQGQSFLFISHDMAVVEHICDDIAVMYLGKIIEQATRNAFFTRPAGGRSAQSGRSAAGLPFCRTLPGRAAALYHARTRLARSRAGPPRGLPFRRIPRWRPGVAAAGMSPPSDRRTDR